LREIVAVLLIVFFRVQLSRRRQLLRRPRRSYRKSRDYRMGNEDRIVRELSEFLAIPNIASDTPNVQKNAAHLVEMLEARGSKHTFCQSAGAGPVVFGKLISAEAKRTVIFYAHYDGQPVDPAAWTDGKPFGAGAARCSHRSWRKADSLPGKQRATPGDL